MVESINTGIPVSPRGNRRMVREIAAVASFCLGLKTAGAQARTAVAEVPTGGIEAYPHPGWAA